MDNSTEVRQAKIDAFIKSRTSGFKVGSKEYNQKRKEAIKDLKEMELVDDKGKAVEGIKGLKAWAKAEAGAMSSSERVSINGKGVNFTSSLTKDGAKAIARIDALSSNKEGFSNVHEMTQQTKVETTDGWLQRVINDVNKKMPNATPEQKAVAIINKLADFKKAETYTDPKKNIAYEFGETAAMAVGVLGAAGLAIGGGQLIESITKGKVKLNTDELKKQGAVFNEKTGFWEKDGVKVANREGFATKANGEEIKKGWVSKSWDWTKDRLSGKNTESNKQPVNSTPNNSTNQSTNDSDTNPDHKTPPNNESKESVTQKDKKLNTKLEEIKKLKEKKEEISKIHTSAPELFEDLLNKKEANINADVSSGKLSPEAGRNKIANIEALKEKLSRGEMIKSFDLKAAGINLGELKGQGFVINDNGGKPFVDFHKTTQNFEKAKKSSLKSIDKNIAEKNREYRTLLNNYTDDVKSFNYNNSGILDHIKPSTEGAPEIEKLITHSKLSKLGTHLGIIGTGIGLATAAKTYNDYLKKGMSPLEALGNTTYDVADDTVLGALTSAGKQYNIAVNDFNNGNYGKGFIDTLMIPVKAGQAAGNNIIEMGKDIGNISNFLWDLSGLQGDYGVGANNNWQSPNIGGYNTHAMSGTSNQVPTFHDPHQISLHSNIAPNLSQTSVPSSIPQTPISIDTNSIMLGGNVTGNIGSLGGGFRDTEATYESIGGNSQIVNQLSQMK